MTEKQMNILEEYERYLNLKGLRVIKRFILEVEEYFRYLLGFDIEYDRIAAFMGDDYRTYLVTEKNLSRGTVNNKLNRLNNFYRFLLKKNHIQRNPFYGTERLKVTKSLPKKILSIDEMGKLLNNYSIRNDYDVMTKSIVELLYGSGLRISEAVTLKLDDIDFENETIYITESKNNDLRRKCMTNRYSLNAVKEYIKYTREKLVSKDEDYLYPIQPVGNYVCLLNSKLEKECKRLNLPVISTHCFRHSVATQLLRAGAGIREVQAFLGHKSIKTTEIYTRVVKEDLKKVIEKYHPRENMEENL